MFSSFKSKLLSLIVGILLTASVAFMIITSRAVERETLKAAQKTTQDELALVMRTIENEYQSLSYHREYALSRYKEQVKNLVSVVMYRLDARRELALRGLITEKEAKQTALDSLEPIRYGHNDYFFAVDYQTLRSLSHPDPAIMGTDMTNFQDIKGKYVVREQQRVVREHGEGYVSHWHIRLGELQPRQKLTYVRLFKPWGWIVGTGIYIDDIEADTQRKLKDILQQLQKNFSQMTIGQTGYFFLFDGKTQVLIHPDLAAQNLSDLGDPTTRANHFKEMMKVASTPAIPYRYYWNHPDDPKNYTYLKEAYIRFFEPLDWYVGASVYLDELRAPAREIVKKQILLTSIVFLFAIALAYALVNRVSKPLNQLTAYARQVVQREFAGASSIASSIDEIGRSIRDEVGRLAQTFAYMIRSLQDYIQKLTETTAARERIESELRIAHDIQMSMLPKIFPPFPERTEFDICAAIAPAREVGGDFYDFFFIDDDHFCLAIGDVSGKGVPASLFMAVTKTLLKATASKVSRSEAILTRLNQELCRDNDSCMFVTIFCGILNVRTGEMEYSNGGHNLPYFLCDGRIKLLDNTAGMALGVTENASYRSGRIMLDRGDALFLYTDGVTEAMDPAGELFSDQRLEQFLAKTHGSSLRQIVGVLVDEVKKFAAGAPQSDDITALALRYAGPAERSDESLEIHLKSDLSELEKLSQGLTEFGGKHHLSHRVLHDLNLVLEEVFTNIISYGYSDSGEHVIRVRLRVEPGTVVAEVEDDGQAFNPLAAPEPDVTKPIDERTAGGLGIHLVRKLTDGLDYARQGNRNLLIMKKKTEEA